MSWFDYGIVILPLCFIVGTGFYCRKYIKGVTWLLWKS